MDQIDELPALDRVATSGEDAATRPALACDPDGDVLLLVECGDTGGALRRLMDRHGAAVYRFCREALHDVALADDVLQQVFLGAFRDLPRFGGRSRLRTWLFKIAHHRVLDAVRSRHCTRLRTVEADLATLPDAQPAAIATLEQAELHAALVSCVRDLDEQCQAALLLRYQQGFTFEEMARICGEKANTLQARVARALPTLRAHLERRLDGSRRGVPPSRLSRDTRGG